MPNPVRLLSPASIGQQKSRHKNSLLLFPPLPPLPMSRPRASSHQAKTSWSAELPVPVPCTHFFYALNMIMAGYVDVPCSYQQTLQNKGDHQQLQQLAHNNKTFEVREGSRFQSPESGPKHRRSTSLRACVCSRLSRARLSACRRRSFSLLRSSLSSAAKVDRLVLRDSMGASKLDLWRIRFSTIRKVNTPREGKL